MGGLPEPQAGAVRSALSVVYDEHKRRRTHWKETSNMKRIRTFQSKFLWEGGWSQTITGVSALGYRKQHCTIPPPTLSHMDEQRDDGNMAS